MKWYQGVSPSVRTYQHSSHWMDFHEMWCLGLLQESVEKTRCG